MYEPELSEFLERAEHGDLVPVYREIVADLETPVSAFLKLQNGNNDYSFLLESVAGGENIARYSYIATEPSQLLISKGRDVRIIRNGRVETRTLPPQDDPLDVLEELMSECEFVPLPGWQRFAGGAVGYMGYDLVRFFEELPSENPDDLGLPDCQFMFANTLVVFDHLMHRIRVLANARIDADPQAAYWDARERIDRLLDRLSRPLQRPETPRAHNMTPEDPTALKSTMTRSEHYDIVLRAKEYIRAGDVIQVVLSHRMSTQVQVPPFTIYRTLRAINPSPYMFYLSFDDLKLIGASPETLVTEDRAEVITRPIAGTRPRGRTDPEDRRLQQELMTDDKERAEHVMLVDLHRNDLGRVCVPGTVEVDDLMTVERYSHVMHIVSNIRGRLRPDKNQFDVLRAAFPAGTLSGAPKIRAMEIIEELEPVRRGPYGGAIGYFSFSGAMDTCITLRTVIMKGQTCYFQAGGGIVADSDPDSEYEETLMKAGALLDAVRMAERGEL